MVHLHVHSEFSSLDGVNTIEDLVNYESDAIAITDHGYMYGNMPFYNACKRAGKKPILGVEGYLNGSDFLEDRFFGEKQKDSFHILLLAKDAEGYRNLCKMMSIAATEDFYRTPILSKKNMEENAKNIVALSGCAGGIISSLILKNEIDDAVALSSYFYEVFGDQYYLELMTADVDGQETVNRGLIEVHKKTNIPIVVTCDAHYPRKEDAYLQGVKFAIAGNGQVDVGINEKNEVFINSEDSFFNCKNLYLMDEDEVSSILKTHGIPSQNISEAIQNTENIASMCNVNFGDNERVYPEFQYNGDHFTHLKNIANDGLKRINKQNDIEYQERINYELSVAKDLKLVDYFLICNDLIQFCDNNNILTGPGRGSAASSLICYALGITQADPIEYDLSFNRFLTVAEDAKYNKDGTISKKYKSQRISPADLDMDFSARRRGNVIEYLQKKYNNIYKIATYSKMNIRSALKDVGRVIGVPYHIINVYTKNIPYDAENSIDLTKIGGYKELQAAYPELFVIANRISGSVRHVSSHAAGIVISPDPIYNHMFAYRKDTKDKCNIHIMQAEKDMAEQCGFLKLDILGLKTLDVLEDTIKLSGDNVEIDGNNIDNDVIGKINTNNIIGVFQFDGEACKPNIDRIKPKTLKELAVVNAISRPGAAKHVSEYITNRDDPKKLYQTGKAEIDKILDETNGILLYQEQVMAISGVLANYNAVEQDVLRKFIGKKESKEKISKYEEGFIERSVKNGFEKEDVEKYWSLIVDHGGYSFNKSHAISYSLLGYYCLYLKYKYPIHFMAALLNSYSDDVDYVKQCVSEFRKNGYKIYPPTLNNKECVPEKDGVRIGYLMVDGIGQSAKTMEQIDILKNIGIEKAISSGRINTKILHNLVYAGAFDGEMDRGKAILMLDESHQLSLFNDEEKQMPTKREIYQHEMDVLGFWINEHPFGEYNITKTNNGFIGAITGMKTTIDKNGKKMAFVKIETESSVEEAVLFSNLYSLLESVDLTNHVVFINAKRGDRGSYIINDIKILSEHKIEIDIGKYDLKKLNAIKDMFVYDGRGNCILRYSINGVEKIFDLGNNFVFSIKEFASFCKEQDVKFKIR